jgi:hypothetical protein
MFINRESLKTIVSELLSELVVTDFQDDVERRLSAELGALPIGISLWSQVFLAPKRRSDCCRLGCR